MKSTNQSINQSINVYHLVKGFQKVGGIDGLWSKYPLAIGVPDSIGKSIAPALNKTVTTMAMTTMTTLATMSTAASSTSFNNSTVPVAGCYKVDPNWDHMFRPLDDKEYPWIGLWFSLPVTGIWYWCTDQVFFLINKSTIEVLLP